jgi:hypothetical protein
MGSKAAHGRVEGMAESVLQGYLQSGFRDGEASLAFANS